MEDAKVSRCANPECDEEFKKLGDGKLFVRPVNGPQKTGLRQKVLWLCSECARHYDLRYDRRKQVFQLVHLRHAA